MDKNLGDWNKYLDKEFKKDYFIKLEETIDNLYKEKTIYPPYEDIFKAFKLTQYKEVSVVIIGQDPYHEKGQAIGLAFSVPSNVKNPPSLVNIFKEINNEYGYLNTNGDLTNWAKQGVLLLNATLTVEDGKANSHQKIGWSKFTDEVIRILNNKNTPICFVLWGNNAIKKKELITNPIHLVLESVHPSPLSCYQGFFGNNHFIKINEFLNKNGLKQINFKN